MKPKTMQRPKIVHACLAAIALAGTSTHSLADSSLDDSWTFRLSLYGWVPDISGQATLKSLSSNIDVRVAPNDYLSHLNAVFKGNVEVRKGRWGVMTDWVYMDLSKNINQSRDLMLDALPLPISASANVDYALQSTIWTLAGLYNLTQEREWTLDALLGVRYFNMQQTVAWNIRGDLAGNTTLLERSGVAEGEFDNTDVIAGLKGRYAFGAQRRWFVPFYLDVGRGDSDLTTQLAAGVGYAFDWGDVSAHWRYLHYDMPADRIVRDMDFSGPALEISLTW